MKIVRKNLRNQTILKIPFQNLIKIFAQNEYLKTSNPKSMIKHSLNQKLHSIGTSKRELNTLHSSSHDCTEYNIISLNQYKSTLTVISTSQKVQKIVRISSSKRLEVKTHRGRQVSCILMVLGFEEASHCYLMNNRDIFSKALVLPHHSSFSYSVNSQTFMLLPHQS